MPSVILQLDPHELLRRNCVKLTRFFLQEYAVKIIGGETKIGCALNGRTLPKTTDDSDMYNRAFPTGGNFLFFVVCMMSLFCLP